MELEVGGVTNDKIITACSQQKSVAKPHYLCFTSYDLHLSLLIAARQLSGCVFP